MTPKDMEAKIEQLEIALDLIMSEIWIQAVYACQMRECNALTPDIERIRIIRG
jgi:hypothetical protein